MAVTKPQLSWWKSLLLVFLPALVVFVVLDIAWIAFVIGKLYRDVLGDSVRSSPDVLSGAIAWLCIVGSVYVFVLPSSRSVLEGVQRGAMMGFLLYGCYECTNMSVINTWTWALTAADMAWGTFACAQPPSLGIHTLCAAALPASYAASSLLMLLYFLGSGSAATSAGKVGRAATAVTIVCAHPVSRMYLLISMIVTQSVYAVVMAYTALVPLPSSFGLQALSAAGTAAAGSAAGYPSSISATAAAAGLQQWQNLAGGPPGPFLAAGIVCTFVLLVSEHGRPLRGRVRWEIEQGSGANHNILAQGARLAARDYLMLLFGGLNLTLLGHAALAVCQSHLHPAMLCIWAALSAAYLTVAALVNANAKTAARVRVA
ncbi:MAG: hypothetical protein WDW36_001485 [Sanguina aurantia]